jgi:hypothetical protein
MLYRNDEDKNCFLVVSHEVLWMREAVGNNQDNYGPVKFVMRRRRGVMK